MPRDARGRFVAAGNASGVWSYVDLNLSTVIQKEAAVRLNNCAEMLVGYIRERMSEPKTGRWYTIPGTDEKYQASAPGEYPAVRTGTLWLSLEAQKVSSTKFIVGRSVD